MKYSPLLLIICVFLLSACEPKPHQVVIAISKSKPVEYYGAYSKWVKKAYPDAEIINMYELGVDSALKTLEDCNALIVTGGADVYPEWYGKIEDTIHCGSFDRYRDTLEIELIKKAINNKMPILGICRGEQILNVTLGGSLIVDIPKDRGTLIRHRQEDWDKCFHQVTLVENSQLSDLSGMNEGKVNSNHHQAIDRLADDLTITSYSYDSIPESVEWKDPSKKGFMMAVQWHPERLDSVNTSLSMTIINELVKHAALYRFP